MNLIIALILAAGPLGTPAIRPQIGKLIPSHAASIAAVPVASHPFGTPGCYATGSTMGGTLPVTFGGRASLAENTVGGSTTYCTNNLARVSDDGLIIEGLRAQYVTSTLAPSTETKILTIANYYARIEGAGSDAIAVTTAVSAQLPCTATEGSGCYFNVGTAGGVTFTVTPPVTFAQVESGGFPSSKITWGTTRQAETASIANPLPIGNNWCVATTIKPTGGRSWVTAVGQQGIFAANSYGAANSIAVYFSSGTLQMETYDSGATSKKMQIALASGSLAAGSAHRWLFGVTSGVPTVAVDGSQIGMHAQVASLDGIVGAGTGNFTSQAATMNLGYRTATNESYAAQKNVKFYNKGCASAAVKAAEGVKNDYTVVAMGDSITYGYGRVATPWPKTLWSSSLGLPWYVTNAGVSGETTTQILARWNSTYAAFGYRRVIVLAGINDVMNDVAEATIESNLAALYTDARAKGATQVIAVTMTPWNNFASYTAGREAVRVAVNAWITAYCAANPSYMTCVDASTDFDDGTGQLKAAYDYGDFLHLNQAGADRMAVLLRAAFP